MKEIEWRVRLRGKLVRIKILETPVLLPNVNRVDNSLKKLIPLRDSIYIITVLKNVSTKHWQTFLIPEGENANDYVRTFERHRANTCLY